MKILKEIQELAAATGYTTKNVVKVLLKLGLRQLEKEAKRKVRMDTSFLGRLTGVATPLFS